MSTTVELPFAPPYERGKALALIAAHAVPGAERVDLADYSVTRVINSPGGPVAVRVALGTESVTATVSSSDARDVEAVASSVRLWFDLDLEPSSIVDAFGRDPRLGPLVAARPGLRVVGHPDGYEAALTTVLGQQVSLASARTFAGRLVAAFGEPGPDSLMLFPAPTVLAGVPLDELQRAIGLTGARTRTLHAVAQACADGLQLTPSADLVLRRVLGVRTAAEAERIAEPWRPIRAYALMHIWTAAAFS